MLVAYFIFFFSPFAKAVFKQSLTMNHLACSLVLLVLIVFSVEDKLEPVKWNKLVFGLFFCAGAGVVVISFLHPIGSGYRAWGLMMMFGFPCLYFVWNNREDYNELYKSLSAATVTVGILYYAYCMKIAFKGMLAVGGGRVNGTFGDANMYSMIGMIMVCSALYMLLVNRGSKAWFLLTLLGFGVGMDITWLGQSRLSILVVLEALFAFSIYYLKIKNDFTASNTRAIRLLRAELLLISFVVFLFVGRMMVSVNNEIIARMSFVSVSSTEEMLCFETGQNEIEIALTGTDTDENAIDRFIPDGGDADSYTAGRYSIWKGYAQFLNMTGNDFSKADWRALTGKTVKHAHNNFLEIAYRCGIPVACVHILLELVAGIISIIYLFSKRYRDPAYLFVVLFMVTYAIQSFFDIATIPFERPAPFFFYMAMIPIFAFKRNDKKEGDSVVADKNGIMEVAE